MTTNAQIAKEAYIYAIALINHNLRQIKKRFPRVKSAYLNTYIDGFATGLQEKFREQTNRNNWGLILVTPEQVINAYKALNPMPNKPRGPEPKHSKNINAFAKGFIDGNNFEHDTKNLTKPPKQGKI